MTLADLKKLKVNVENLHTEKVKLEKQNSKKPGGKAKGKITLKKESDVSKKLHFYIIKSNQINLNLFIFRISMSITNMATITLQPMMITMISCK